MERKELKWTKVKLILIFTFMMFLVVLVLWYSYFFYKYLTEKNLDNNIFYDFMDSFSSGKITKENILSRENEIFYFQKNGETDTKYKKFDKNIRYILFDENGNILKYDVKIDTKTEKDFLKKIFDYREDYKKSDNSQNYVFEEHWNYILWFYENFVFIKEYKYSKIACLSDFFRFLILDLLFSLLFSFIWILFINRILKPVEENISEMKNFVHNAWHELKTPISVIDSNIQLMLELKTYDEEMLKELKVEVLKLNSLLDSLIKISDIWAFGETEKINLSFLIDEILKNFSEKIEEKNLSVTKNMKDDIFVVANRNYLYIFLSNIIWNSIKYNKNLWQIYINYNNKLKIEDTWIGISNEDLPKVFDRFFKVDKSRNTPGFWIGLSLVAKIAETYRWNVKVESEIWKWTKFFIKF